MPRITTMCAMNIFMACLSLCLRITSDTPPITGNDSPRRKAMTVNRLHKTKRSPGGELGIADERLNASAE